MLGHAMDYDLAYTNGAFIAGADDFPPMWQRCAAQYRAALGRRAELDLVYGSKDRNRFDLFWPETTPHGLLVFVHGGYWMAFGRESWSHLAAGAVARGWAVAIPSYTLAPQARITDIIAEIAASAIAAAARVAGPVVITGHSAGGHLAARLGCTDTAMPRLRRVVPISALADLAPLMYTKLNDQLWLTPHEAAHQSPANHALSADVQAHVWVGGQERPSFLWQARTLSEHWSCAWTVAAGKHHFDVIDDLKDPNSALMAACLDGL